MQVCRGSYLALRDSSGAQQEQPNVPECHTNLNFLQTTDMTAGITSQQQTLPLCLLRLQVMKIRMFCLSDVLCAADISAQSEDHRFQAYAEQKRRRCVPGMCGGKRRYQKSSQNHAMHVYAYVST